MDGVLVDRPQPTHPLAGPGFFLSCVYSHRWFSPTHPSHRACPSFLTHLTLRALHRSHDGVRFGLTPAAPSSLLVVLLPTTLAEDTPSAAVVVIPASWPLWVLLLPLLAPPGFALRFLGAEGPGPASEAVELAWEDMAQAVGRGRFVMR